MATIRRATKLRAGFSSCPLARRRSQTSSYSTSTSAQKSPRHLTSIADLTHKELEILVKAADRFKTATKSGRAGWKGMLDRQTIAVMFNKRSTRTRVSTEGAVSLLGGHPMFLGSQDIQFGANESLRDTSTVISSMTSGIVSRVGPHSDIEALARYSSVPLINALSDLYHPMQALADVLTLYENMAYKPTSFEAGLGLAGKRITWVGDATNVLFDLALASAHLGMKVVAATPAGYDIPPQIFAQVKKAAKLSPTPGSLTHTNSPEEAIKGADVIVTDTWISMGQEAEKQARLKAFEGFQVTQEMAKKGGAKPNWVFMHCLPRKPEEVSDEVFYGDRSLVFPEAENRLWTAAATLAAFVGKQGNIDDSLLESASGAT